MSGRYIVESVIRRRLRCKTRTRMQARMLKHGGQLRVGSYPRPFCNRICFSHNINDQAEGLHGVITVSALAHCIASREYILLLMSTYLVAQPRVLPRNSQDRFSLHTGSPDVQALRHLYWWPACIMAMGTVRCYSVIRHSVRLLVDTGYSTYL
ncbi:hypothetical protein F4861DRAFT_519363 [Xylaria intraflava]|nr:hypothetical protein F4861DRAFT_519363 [Xylaria intraflava]